MPQFSYKARDSAGKLTSGTLEAADERSVAVTLTQAGLQLIRVKKATLLEELLGILPLKRSRIERQDVLILLREMAALLRSGIPLASGLEGMIQQTQSPALRQVLEDVIRRVREGSSFSKALAHHPRAFPDFFISMIRVGEVAGILDEVLNRLAQMGLQELETRSRIQSALIYPLVLVGFALVVVNGLLLGVLPKFVSVFEASDMALPLPTRFLLGLSTTVRGYWWCIALVLFAGLWWIRRYYDDPKGRWQVDVGFLKVPLAGILYRKMLIARLTRALGAMLKTGVPLLEALNVAERLVPNVVFQRTLQLTRSAVAEGKPLSEPWARSGLFPPLVLQMVSVGERSGQLDAMLTEVAAFYDPEIDLATQRLTSLLEPVLLLVMGLMVGFIALSVLLPIFQLVSVFKR